MEWFSQNWVWVLFFAGMIAMHMFGHGGHSGHSGHVSGSGDDDDHDPKSASKDTAQRPSQQSPNHRH